MVDINGSRCYIHTEMDCCETGDNLSLKVLMKKLKILLTTVFVQVYEIIGGSFSLK